MKWNLLFKLLSVRSNFSKCGFLFLGSILTINHSLFSYKLFIGDIKFSDPVHLNQTENLPLEEVIDGDTSTAGWTLAKDAGVGSIIAHSIDVTLAQPTLPTLQPGERVDHYT